LSTGTEISDTAAVTFTSMMPTICGGAVNDTDKLNATGNCLKVATDGSGNWFTSTPSIAVMDALGYSTGTATSDSADNDGKTYSRLVMESGSAGPLDGEFATFRQDGQGVINPGSGDDNNAGVKGQLDRWCQNLASIEFGGKNTWRRPTKNELEALRNANGDMWASLGWPGKMRYWSSTINLGSNYLTQGLHINSTFNNSPSANFYASCVAPVPIKMCGTGVNDTDPNNAGGNCLKVASDAAGNWFTSTPSVALMNELGYTVDNSGTNSGKTYASTYTESGKVGPIGGVFARFRQDGAGVVAPGGGDDANAGVDGQFDRWCQDLALRDFAGRATWRRPTLAEFANFRSEHGNLWKAFGWPAYFAYWTSTVNGPEFQWQSPTNFIFSVDLPSFEGYASCVSENP
ncbi:TPA: hypothetical protein ACVU5P_004987, partial [Vibrio parahaemolyticus]